MISHRLGIGGKSETCSRQHMYSNVEEKNRCFSYGMEPMHDVGKEPQEPRGPARCPSVCQTCRQSCFDRTTGALNSSGAGACRGRAIHVEFFTDSCAYAAEINDAATTKSGFFACFCLKIVQLCSRYGLGDGCARAVWVQLCPRVGMVAESEQHVVHTLVNAVLLMLCRAEVDEGFVACLTSLGNMFTQTWHRSPRSGSVPFRRLYFAVSSLVGLLRLRSDWSRGYKYRCTVNHRCRGFPLAWAAALLRSGTAQSVDQAYTCCELLACQINAAYGTHDGNRYSLVYLLSNGSEEYVGRTNALHPGELQSDPCRQPANVSIEGVNVATE